MPPEAVERRRLSKATRRYVRELKREARQVMGVTEPQPDTTGRHKLEEFLSIKLGPEYGEKIAQHIQIFWEYFEIRQQIHLGGFQKELIEEFQAKYDPDLLFELKSIFPLVREFVGRQS